MMQNEWIGRTLVKRGLLSAAQVEQVTRRLRTDDRPFVTVAATLFDLDETTLWDACAQALARRCKHVKLARETYDPDCLYVVSPQQAWESLVLPLRSEAGELICATTEETLASAMAVMQQAYDGACRFVLADIRPLEQFVAERYAYEGVELEE